MKRKIHGDSKTKSHLYNTWRAMKARCYNENNEAYKWYGGRGIVVCDEWKESYINFKQWAQNNGYVDGLTIERIDTNGNYEPNNCCWKTMLEQANNRNSNVDITYNGKTQTLKQWSEQIGIPYQTLQYRICDAGWSIERSLTEPLAYNKNQIVTDRILRIYTEHPEYSGCEIARQAGCGSTKVYNTLKKYNNDKH